MGRVLEQKVTPTRLKKSERGVGADGKPMTNFERLNGLPVLIWTDEDERRYRDGSGPPPFE